MPGGGTGGAMVPLFIFWALTIQPLSPKKKNEKD